MAKNMSRFFKPLYVMIVFISLFLVVRDVKAGKPFHSSFSTFLLYLIYNTSSPIVKTPMFLFYIIGLAHFCDEYNPCPEHLCMPDMKVVCTPEELCLCIKLI
jgi:hypothetical protein